MKVHALVLLVFSMSAGAVTYYPNDGTSPPGSFTEKQEETPKESKTVSKKVIKKTVKEKQEVREVSGDKAKDKPVLDSNPNDETYKIGPLNTPNSSEEE